MAIKSLSPHLARDESALRRFEREARAVAALKHPNIVVLHAFEREGDRPFIVMELIDGQTLDAALPQSGMDVSRVVEIGVAIADALEAAHAAGLAHRDLKLANVMLGRDGRVRVLDFGLACRTDGRASRLNDAETVTDAGLVLGTVGLRIHNLPDNDVVHAAAARPPGRHGTTVNPADVLLHIEAIGKYVPDTKTTFRIERAGNIVTLSMPGTPGAQREFDLLDYPKLFDERSSFLFFGNSARRGRSSATCA